MKLDITVQRLQCFVEAADQQSFRRAAEALNLTQPALSQHIQVLERILRVSLFERSAKGARLTPLGQQLVTRARAVLNSVDRLEEFADNLAAGQDGTISIACYPVHIERFLGSIIGAFRRDYPRIRLDLTRLRDDRRRGLGRSLLAGFNLQVEADSSTPSALLVLGRQGLGIPILPDDYPLVGQQRYPYPVLTSPAGAEVSTPVWLQWRLDGAHGPLIAHFLQYVRDEVEYERLHGRRRECYYQADLSPAT